MDNDGEDNSFLFKILDEDEGDSLTDEEGADEESSLPFFKSESSKSKSSGFTSFQSESFKVTLSSNLISFSFVKEGEMEEEEEGFKEDSGEVLKKDVMEGVLETGSKHFSPSFLEKFTNLLTSHDKRPFSLG